MTIQVLVSNIDNETFQKILDYYNSNKSGDEETLERLDRAEGGFQIKLPENEIVKRGENYRIRQLRWSKGNLIVAPYTIGFTEKQEILLFDALNYALNGNVLLKNI
jgi:hypothetical protein